MEEKRVKELALQAAKIRRTALERSTPLSPDMWEALSQWQIS